MLCHVGYVDWTFLVEKLFWPVLHILKHNYFKTNQVEKRPKNNIHSRDQNGSGGRIPLTHLARLSYIPICPPARHVSKS